MKSPSGLPPQMAGMHQLSQQRTAAVLRIPKAFVQDIERPHHRVQADQVRGFQRSHLVPEAFLEDRVDLLGRRHVILQHKRGLVHEQVGNPVDTKPGMSWTMMASLPSTANSRSNVSTVPSEVWNPRITST